MNGWVGRDGRAAAARPSRPTQPFMPLRHEYARGCSRVFSQEWRPDSVAGYQFAVS